MQYMRCLQMTWDFLQTGKTTRNIMKAKTIIGGTILAASSVLAGPVMAGSFSANIGVTSDYLWRGITQTGDQAAIQGGMDYSNDSGFYAGTWMSNVSWTDPNGYELDLYAGYRFDTGSVSWDAGYIYYAYPLTSNANGSASTGDYADDFGEVYLNVGWKWLGGGVAYQTNAATNEPGAEKSGNLYYFVSAEGEQGGVGYGGKLGRYTFKNASSSDYNYLELYLSKSDFTFSVSKTDADETAWGTTADDVHAWVSWSKTIDL